MNGHKEKGERIAKVLARAGVCSRRDAERLVAEGRVTVNGKKITGPALNVAAGDRIVVDGKNIAGAAKTRLWLYHKPPGLVTSHKDEHGRASVFDALPKNLPRVISVGRLDLNSEGLLLLTNDGELSRALELPANALERTYRVRAFGNITQGALDKLRDGIKVGGVSYGPIAATIEKQQSSNAWLAMTLTEGKNREIRRVLEHLGLSVNRLIRVSYGPFRLGALPRGGVEEVPPEVLSQLRLPSAKS